MQGGYTSLIDVHVVTTGITKYTNNTMYTFDGDDDINW